MPSVATICKIIGFVVAATVLGVAISFIFVGNKSFLDIVRVAYLIFFALMLGLAEANVQFFLKYFNFLEVTLGRGIFIIFLGSILLSKQIYAIVIGVIIIVVGFAYILVGRKVDANGVEAPAAGPQVIS